ncbi:energy-coupling factor transporter ATP-binding protein EcfA2 [Actinoplanes lutulentus]|uniref:NACHT domain-containing protein n=1 Tax=Actinoplanes lutulentus TaxID=1287878 RepID=UPI0015ECCA44|nr:NACHT domain-containing protein [Actinoplanes lutulentus]MBB2946927.1 energy-coupling factor transporter ATP-binding protein EcfA2 [Actinoplanes lutulentus]
MKENFARHRLGFVNEQTATSTVDVMKIYVPLEYQAGEERKDVYEWLRRQMRVVILGPPGAGKSMLLKHSMLIWAGESTPRSARLPVLIDLHRCNANNTTLDQMIHEELSRNDIRMNPALLDISLREGKLALLLDGLDEVSQEDQNRVSMLLRDFARKYSGCQMLVTCRSAAYSGQLQTEFMEHVQVADFDDANIRRFLTNWPNMTDADSTRLFYDLQHNQNLMRLAASPLLLTMIAYIHTEVLAKNGRSLPGNRPAFYEMAIDHLLKRDHDLARHNAISVYDWQEKLAVLQKIALTLQETPTTRPDRRSIDGAELIAITKRILPDLNLGPEHAKLLIDEIDQRSQLLVKLDRRSSRYAFPHLTLQEYLAAVELTAQPETLLQRYFADRPAWRETVKLWCGASSRDCTDVVRTILNSASHGDQILALECLAEAKRIDDTFAREVIVDSMRATTSLSWDERAVTAAFAAVAADGRPRGEFTFNLLVDQAKGGEEPGARWSMAALAGTRLPRAAAFLSELAAAGDPQARAALRSMGEQAITALTSAAWAGSLQALDDLAVVGTPAASEALTSMLWNDDAKAVRSAWHLAALMQNSEIEANLRLSDVSVRTECKRIDWVWQPFSNGASTKFEIIVGRVAYLVDRGFIQEIPSEVKQIDPRLAIPLGIIAAVSELKPVDTSPSEDLMREFGSLGLNVRQFPHWLAGERALSSFYQTTMPARVASVCDHVLDAHHVSPYRKRIIRMMDDRTYVEAIVRVFCRFRPKASKEQWLTVQDDPAKPRLLKSCAYLSVGLLVACLIVLGIGRAVGTVAGVWPWGPPGLSAVLTILVIPVLAVAFFAFINDIFDAFNFADPLVDFLEKFVGRYPWAVALWAAVSVSGLTTLALSAVASWTNWPVAVAALAFLVAQSYFLTLRYRDRISAIDNALRPIRDRAQLNASNRLSIIGNSL